MSKIGEFEDTVLVILSLLAAVAVPVFLGMM